MARNPARDERQGDLFGAPPPPAKPARRTSPPRPAREETPAAPASLATLGAKPTRPEIDELLDSMRDQELAYLAVEATRLVKRRLIRGQGRGRRPKGAGSGKSPLDDALVRISGELMEFEDPGETW